ncbi:hypothetical protein DW1_1776 [Proteiniborus sp. DW1]|uniref:GNAT family N-acetyltransferase n=1 Tax=Proteiniborus sp. DW1 TaxID=1889883 RepID=UPI00092E0947|nr:GNAT family N-acetyltransferase [Proteiniborus sp. DW1]SCG83346.1 hypothetical protein DW1_1776 [Proteiniborus sp. DW1]
MIVVRKTINLEEIEFVANILNKNNMEINISKSSICFIIEDNSAIVGGCSLITNYDYAIIDFLIIDEKRRGEKLGDGLLRGVLNYCLRRNISKAYFIGHNQYLIKKGFCEVDKNIREIILGTTMNSDTVLECDVEEFFNKDCSSCRRS